MVVGGRGGGLGVVDSRGEVPGARGEVVRVRVLEEGVGKPSPQLLAHLGPELLHGGGWADWNADATPAGRAAAEGGGGPEAGPGRVWRGCGHGFGRGRGRGFGLGEGGRGGHDGGGTAPLFPLALLSLLPPPPFLLRL